MTTPLDRAEQYMRESDALALGNDPQPASYRDYARDAFQSIDTDELRDLISGWPIGTGYYGTQIGTDEAYELALAVKNWLTGKDNR